MSYNMTLDYPYQERIRKWVADMEKNVPLYQPSLESGRHAKRGGIAPEGAEVRNKEVNPYSQFSHYYKETPKSYKSSGNEGYKYFNQNELNNINKMNMATINYDKNSYNNSRKPIERDQVEIYDSIFEAFKDDFDATQLKGAGMKQLNPKEKVMANLIIRTSKKLEGGISKETFKKALKISAPVARKVAATGVKVGLPLVSGAVAQSLGIPAPVAVIATKIAADALAKKIGGLRPLKSVLKPVQTIKPLKGGMTKAQKEKIAKNVIKTFGAVALTGAVKYILPKVIKYVGEKYGVSPELANEIFGIARFLVEATVSHNISGGCDCVDDCDCDVGYIGKGFSYKDTSLGQRDKALHDMLSNVVKKHLSGGKLDTAKFKSAALKLGKAGAPIIAKQAIPLATKAIGDSLGLPPTTTQIVGKILGEVVSQQLKTGKGKKSIKKDIGKYKGGAKPTLQSKQKARAALVKKVMMENNLNLPQASKYIKENNLQY